MCAYAVVPLRLRPPSGVRLAQLFPVFGGERSPLHLLALRLALVLRSALAEPGITRTGLPLGRTSDGAKPAPRSYRGAADLARRIWERLPSSVRRSEAVVVASVLSLAGVLHQVVRRVVEGVFVLVVDDVEAGQRVPGVRQEPVDAGAIGPTGGGVQTALHLVVDPDVGTRLPIFHRNPGALEASVTGAGSPGGATSRRAVPRRAILGYLRRAPRDLEPAFARLAVLRVSHTYSIVSPVP